MDGKRQTTKNWSAGGPYNTTLVWQGHFLRDMGVAGTLYTFYLMP
jgi:hypothetical protein